MERRSRNSQTATVLAALSLAIQGCASTGKPVTQSVRVETPGCTLVACELSNDLGSWRLPRTPGSLTVTTSRSPLKVSCWSEEGSQGGIHMLSSMDAATGAGAVAGGALGGAGVGAALGATALAFVPVFGVIIVLTGVAAGVTAGAAVESGQRAIRYPDLIGVPMNCSAEGLAVAVAPVAGAAVGLGIRGLLPEQAREAGLGERRGVLVTSVAEGSAAAAAGLRSGDIILSVDGQSLGDASDMEARVIVVVPGTPLTLGIWREGRALELVLTRRPMAP